MSKENNAVDERRHIENMTLGEIKETKARLADRIGEAIEREIDAFNQAYNWGAIEVSVDTQVDYFYSEGYYGDKRKALINHIIRNVTIKSSLEED